MIKSVVTQDGRDIAIQLFLDGKSVVLSTKNFDKMPELLRAVMEQDEEAVREFVITAETLKNFMKGKIEFRGNSVFYNGEELFGSLVDKIIRVRLDGGSPDRLIKFLENLLLNPSEHSRKQLYEFLDRYHFPITEDGHFLAYKKLRSDFTSVHSGFGIVNGKEHTGHLDNSVGNTIEIPRTQVTPEATVACGRGLHCGSLDYVRSFSSSSSPIVIVKVNPADVVSVPNDSSWQKVRVTKYVVTGKFGGEIKSDYTTDTGDTVPAPEKTYKQSSRIPQLNKNTEELNLLRDWAYGVISNYASDKSTVATSVDDLFKKFPLSLALKNRVQKVLPARSTGKIYKRDIVRAFELLSEENK